MENKKQSSVDWLVEQLDNFLELYPSEWEKIIEIKKQAKAMHKEEIEVAQGIAISKADMTNNRGYFDTDKYYNETFGGEN